MEDQSKKCVLKSMPMLFLTDDVIETSSENIPPKESSSVSNVDQSSPSPGKKQPVVPVDTSSGQHPLSGGVKRNKALSTKLYAKKEGDETKSASGVPKDNIRQVDIKSPLESASTSNIMKPPPGGIRRIKMASKSYLQRPVPPLPAPTQIKESVNAPQGAAQPVRTRDKESAARAPISMYSSRRSAKESKYGQNPIAPVPMAMQAKRSASMSYTQRPVCISSAISHMMESAATAYAQQQILPSTTPMPAKEIAGAYYVQRHVVPPTSLMQSRQLVNTSPAPRFFLPPAAAMRILPRVPFIQRPMVPSQMQQPRLQARLPVVQPTAVMSSKETVGTQKIFVPLSANTLTKPSATSCFVKRPVIPTFVTTQSKESNMSYAQVPGPSSNAAQINMPRPQKPVASMPSLDDSIIPEATMTESQVLVSSSFAQKQNIPPSTTSKVKLIASTSSATMQAKAAATPASAQRSSVPLTDPVTTQINVPVSTSIVFKPIASSSATTQAKMLSAASHTQNVNISPSTTTPHVEKQKESVNISRLKKRIGPKSAMQRMSTTLSEAQKQIVSAFATIQPTGAGSMPLLQTSTDPPESSTLQTDSPVNTFHLQQSILSSCAATQVKGTTTATTTPFVQGPIFPPSASTLTREPKSNSHALRQTVPPSGTTQTKGKTNTYYIRRCLVPSSVMASKKVPRSTPDEQTAKTTSNTIPHIKVSANVVVIQKPSVPSSDAAPTKDIEKSIASTNETMTIPSASNLHKPLSTYIKQEILSSPEKEIIQINESTGLPIKQEPTDPSSEKKESKKSYRRNFIVKTTISRSDLNKLREFVRECRERKKAGLASTNKDIIESEQKPDKQEPEKQEPEKHEPDEQKPDRQGPKKPTSRKRKLKCFSFNTSQQKELATRSKMLKYLIELTNSKDKETARKSKVNDNFHIVTPKKRDLVGKSRVKSSTSKHKEMSATSKIYKDIRFLGTSKKKDFSGRRFKKYRDRRLSSSTSEREAKMRSLRDRIDESIKLSPKKSPDLPFHRTPIISDGHGITNDNQGNVAGGIFKPGNYEFPVHEKNLTIKQEITTSNSKTYDGNFSTIPNRALHKRIKLNRKPYRFFYSNTPSSTANGNNTVQPQPAHLSTFLHEPTNIWTDTRPQNMFRTKPITGTLSFFDLKTYFIEKSNIVVPIMTGKCTTDEKGNKILPSQDLTLRKSCTVSRSLVFKNMETDKDTIKSNPLYLGRYRSQFPPLPSSQRSSKYRRVYNLNPVIEEPVDLSHKRKKLRLGKYENEEKILNLSKKFQKTFSVNRSEMPKGISLKRRPSNSDDETSCSYSPEARQEQLWEHQYKTGCLDEMNLVPKEKVITGKVLKQLERFQSLLLSHEIQHKLSEHKIKKEPDELFAEEAMDEYTNHELNKVRKLVNKRSIHIPRYDPPKDQYLPTLEILGMYEGTSRAEDVMCSVPECRVNQYAPELGKLYDLLKTEKPRHRRPLRKYKRKVEPKEPEKTIKTEKLDESIVVKEEPLSPKEPPKNDASFKDLFGEDEEELNTDHDENIKDSIFNLKSIPTNIMNISPIPRKRKANDASANHPQLIPGNGTPIPGKVYPSPQPNMQFEYPIKNPMPNIDPEKTPMLAMRPLVADARVIPEIQNIITTCNLGCTLDLKYIAYHTVNSEYDPNSLSPVIIRIRQPRTTALIFTSGVMVCTGATSEYDAKIATRKHARIIQKLGFSVKFVGYKIMNILARCELSYMVRLEALAVFHYKFCTYEPELFPGLIYYMQKPEVMLMIYPTGKIYLKGAKSRGFVNDAFNNILPVLKMFKKNTY